MANFHSESPPAPGTALLDCRNVHAGLTISEVGGYYDGQSIVTVSDRCESAM